MAPKPFRLEKGFKLCSCYRPYNGVVAPKSLLRGKGLRLGWIFISVWLFRGD